jgi:lysyl endopeptidase
MKNISLILLLTFLSEYSYSQIQTRIFEERGLRDAIGYEKFKTDSKVKKMPNIMAKIEKNLEEESSGKRDGLPFRFGIEIDLNLGLGDGQWVKIGQKEIWTISLQSEGAFSLNLKFDQLRLPEGSEMYIFNEKNNFLIGPITNSNFDNKKGKLSTDLVPGDLITIEIVTITRNKSNIQLHINKLIHGYINTFNYESFGDSESCNIDVSCTLGANWQNEKKGTAFTLTSSGTELCSGGLVNNTCNDYTPFFLTAYHCADSNRNGVLESSELNNLEDWVFRFHYEANTCDGSLTSWISYSGSSFRAGWKQTDFLLVELDQLPQNVTFAGWNRGSTAPTQVTILHHPAGDAKKISQDNSSPSLYEFYETANSHYYVNNWDHGSTTGGSSGGLYFDQNKLVIGQNHAGNGFSDCHPSKGSYFGRLAISWEGGGTPETRLKDWLDPTNTLATTLNILTTNLSLSGPSILCSSNTFSLGNLSSSSSSTWSVTPASLFSGNTSGSGSTAYLTPSGASGLATITYTINSCTSEYIFSKSFWVGKASVNIIGAYDMPYNTVENYYVEGGYPYASQMGLMGITDYYWSVYPSGYDWIGGQGNPGITLTISNPGVYSLELDVTNPCGVKGNEIPIYVYDPWSMFMIFPNPASDIMTVSKKPTLSTKQVDSTPFEISVYDSRGLQLVSPKSGNEQVLLDVSNLKNGFYFVHIMYKGNLIKNQIRVER